MTNRPTLPLLLALALVVTGCFAPRPLEGMDRVESAQTYQGWGDQEKALELAEYALDEEDLDSEAEAEAAFIAAEAARATGNRVLALRRYKWILENAPWSEHTAVIEDRLYELGVAFLTLDEYGGWFDKRSRGVEALETLQMHYRQSDRADDALRLVGDYFGSEETREFLEAALTHQQLADEYPDSEWAERSLWLAGHYRLRLIYGPQYNRDEMVRARDLLERSLREHPKGSSVREATADLAQVKDYMSRGEMIVADFYRGRGNIPGERLHLANAALLFPETKAGMEALRRLRDMGLDLPELREDPRLNSVDAFKAPELEESR